MLNAGLYHTAFFYRTRKDLARIVQRLIDSGYPISGASDHRFSGDPADDFSSKPASAFPQFTSVINSGFM